MNLNAGDIIRIKPNIQIGRYGTNMVVEEMLKYRGQKAKIQNSVEVSRDIEEGEKLSGIEYIIDLDNGYYSWTKEMFNVSIKDEYLFDEIEDMLGISKKEIEQDYITNMSNDPTEEDLIEYTRMKFKNFL